MFQDPTLSLETLLTQLLPLPFSLARGHMTLVYHHSLDSLKQICKLIRDMLKYTPNQAGIKIWPW